MRIIKPLLIGALGLLAATVFQACSKPASAENGLTGVISSQTFPGPPNFTSVEKGDAPESYFLLDFDSGLDVAAKTVEGNEEIVKGVKSIQLIDNTDACKALVKVGARLTLKGDAFVAHTGHHHRSVVIEVKECAVAK